MPTVHVFGPSQRISLIFLLVLLCLASLSLATDEQSLLAFKQSVTRDPNGVLSNWNNSSSNSLHVCNWTGVTCDLQTLRVTELKLNSLQLLGFIPPAIGGLTFLKVLDLGNNSFTGIVPPEIGNCSRLESIVLSDNALAGALPSEIGNCALLKNVSLSNNRFAGAVPRSVGNLHLLEKLRLSNNSFSSGFPLALGNCSAITELDVSSNGLTGETILASLGRCSQLTFLNLSANHLTGPIPSSLGNLVKLSRLHLSSNSLTGGLPTELFNSEGSLGDVVLRDNLLNGSLPDVFNRSQLLTNLDLSNNSFRGRVPRSLGDCLRLVTLSLSHNELTGVIPSSISSLSSFQIGLNLSNNFLSGSIPAELGLLKRTSSIDLSANILSGAIPDTLQNCIGLQILNLSGNSLSGPIPDALDRCTFLEILDLSNNSLTGAIPGGLANLAHLITLNMSNNKLTGSVERFLNFTSASFLPGNDGLCGSILNILCPFFASEAPSTQRHSSERSKVYTLAGAVVVFCFLVILASWFDIIHTRSARRLKDAVTCYARGVQVIRLTVEDLLTATNGFNETHMIGRGGTSTVYKGLLPFYPFIVAVKKFEDNEDGRQRLLKEAGVMSIVRHRNLVGTLGISSVPRSLNVLVLDYITNGTLSQHLHAGDVCELSWDVRLNIAIDVATGVLYLHKESTPHLAVIHGDLKPANIFLESDFTAKVGDFGLAKLLADVDRDERVDRRWEGTFGYSPPGDVYSFGVVILEIVTRRRPGNYFMFGDQGGSFVEWVRAAFPDKLSEIVDPNLAKDLISNKDALVLFLKVGLFCTRDNPRERPTMSEALAMIKKIARSTCSGSSEGLQHPNPLPSIEELIQDSSFTSFQQAKSWGWINQDFIFDMRHSGVYGDYDSWFSLFQLDMRDSRTLKAIGFDSHAIVNIRNQTKNRRALKQVGQGRLAWFKSWIRSAFSGRKNAKF